MSSLLGTIKVVAHTGKLQYGTVIFLHGSGDTGTGACEWIKMLLGKDMDFPHLKVLYPTAPVRSYTPLGGLHSNVWFDRMQISPVVPEHLPTVDSAAQELSDLIQKEVNAGIPYNRIVVGGFSMGGAMAMHLAYRSLPQLGGVFALSSFLNHNSSVYLALKANANVPPLFMCHGDRDELVPHEWGKQTFSMLQQLGVEGQFHTIDNAFHEMKKKELQKLCDWLNEVIPQPTQLPNGQS